MDISFHSHRLVEGRVVWALGKRKTAGAGSIQRGEKILARDALRGGHLAQDGVKSADAQRLVVRNREAVMLRGLRLQDDVATDLVDLTVSPPGAQDPHQITAV